ncbi:hypothetical protein HZH68_000465 [Vespula germanica]|uniref:PPM-type phosphatase domain-containing protein n=2 Tax=Vespula TaxID=7451 RepID=A0A834U622_VESGE|nr:hypothetical protein HZH68_000465 [Vespula germanica]
MAAKTSNDLVDYLGEYRRYFEEFVKKINPEDQLPMKVNAYSITETELIGEIIYLTLQYIKQPRCPRNLQGYLVRLVLQEIKELCEKQPEECGFKLETKSYAPLKLMQAVTSKVNEIFTRYLDNSRLAMLPPPSSKLPPLARSAALKNGKRKMEDRHVEIYDLHTICNVQNDSLASYFAVFDGHGGEDAAVYCATHLHQYLAESIYYPTDPERALCDAFHTTDTRFIEKERTQKVIGGTTAVCVLLLDKKLYIAWVGDSLAMLVKRGKVEELVYPHRLSRYDESERIQQMGGMLAFNQGTVRVNGVLAVSRAIGDVQYKPYVTSTPDTRCISLDGTEDFLIIATDGVWDFVNTYDAAMIVYVAIREYPGG